MKAPKQMNNFEKPAVGAVQAVCQSVHDCGVHPKTGKFAGDGKTQPLFVIVWEISQTITTAGEFFGKRMVVSNRFTFSMGEKSNLRKCIESWFAKKFPTNEAAFDFDFEKLIGCNCILTLALSDDGQYVNVVGVSPIMKDMKRMTPELPVDHKFEWIENLKKSAIVTENESEKPQTPIRTATAADIQTPVGDPHAELSDSLDPEDVPF